MSKAKRTDKPLSKRERRIADRAFELGMYYQQFDGVIADNFLRDKYKECAKYAMDAKERK
jgi:hypothetical protein